MTEPPAPPSSTPPPSPPARSGPSRGILIAILGGVAVVAVLLVVLIVVIASRGDSSDSGGAAGSDGPETFDVSGTMTLVGSPDSIISSGGECFGWHGFDDMIAGAQVVIRNGSGDILADGVLESGRRKSGIGCEFPFTVDGVPAGETIYTVEVAHRGELTFKQDEADSLALTLSE